MMEKVRVIFLGVYGWVWKKGLLISLIYLGEDEFSFLRPVLEEKREQKKEGKDKVRRKPCL
jgi:hypothetical protein